MTSTSLCEAEFLLVILAMSHTHMISEYKATTNPGKAGWENQKKRPKNQNKKQKKEKEKYKEFKFAAPPNRIAAAESLRTDRASFIAKLLYDLSSNLYSSGCSCPSVSRWVPLYPSCHGTHWTDHICHFHHSIQTSILNRRIDLSVVP